MDDVGFQKFSQLSRDRWRLDVTSKQGKKYLIDYHVQPFGFIREVFTGPAGLIWDRDFKAGENVKETWADRVRSS